MTEITIHVIIIAGLIFNTGKFVIRIKITHIVDQHKQCRHQSYAWLPTDSSQVNTKKLYDFCTLFGPTSKPVADP